MYLRGAAVSVQITELALTDTPASFLSCRRNAEAVKRRLHLLSTGVTVHISDVIKVHLPRLLQSFRVCVFTSGHQMNICIHSQPLY